MKVYIKSERSIYALLYSIWHTNLNNNVMELFIIGLALSHRRSPLTVSGNVNEPAKNPINERTTVPSIRWALMRCSTSSDLSSRMKISALRTCFSVFTPRITWNLTVVTRRSQPHCHSTSLLFSRFSNHWLTWKYEWLAPVRETFDSRVDLAPKHDFTLCRVGDI